MQRDFAASEGRLAELVAHLSGCPAPLAVSAVERALPEEIEADKLAVVARAMVLLKRDGDRLRQRRPA